MDEEENGEEEREFKLGDDDADVDLPLEGIEDFGLDEDPEDRYH
jgi:hypothetical protein